MTRTDTGVRRRFGEAAVSSGLVEAGRSEGRVEAFGEDCEFAWGSPEVGAGLAGRVEAAGGREGTGAKAGTAGFAVPETG